MHGKWKPCLSWEHTASSQHASRWKIVSNDAGHKKKSLEKMIKTGYIPFQELCWSSLTLSNIPDLFCSKILQLFSPLDLVSQMKPSWWILRSLGMSKDQSLPVATSLVKNPQNAPTSTKTPPFHAPKGPGLWGKGETFAAESFWSTRNEPTLWFFGDHL